MPPKKKDEDELDLKSLLGLDISSKKKTKKELSEEQKQTLRDRLVVMRETARIKREEKKRELEESKSSDNIVIKSSNDLDSVFEKKYKDKFEMLTEKLNMISNDVTDMKKMKLQKAEAKRHADELKKQQEADKQKQKDLEEAQRKEALQKITPTKSEPVQQQQETKPEPPQPILTNDQSINTPVGKLSFRQRFKNAKY